MMFIIICQGICIQYNKSTIKELRFMTLTNRSQLAAEIPTTKNTTPYIDVVSAYILIIKACF